MRNSPSSRFSLHTHSPSQFSHHPHSQSPLSAQKIHSFSPYNQTNKVAQITFSNRIYAPELYKQERQRRTEQPRFNVHKPNQQKKFQQRLQEVHSKLQQINALAHRLQKRMCITQTEKEFAKKKIQHKFSDYCFQKPARYDQKSRFSPARELSRNRMRQVKQRIQVKDISPEPKYQSNRRLADVQSNQDIRQPHNSGGPSPSLKDKHKQRERRSASPMNELSFKSRAGKKLAQRQNQYFN